MSRDPACFNRSSVMNVKTQEILFVIETVGMLALNYELSGCDTGQERARERESM